jgi:thiamine biosynthesis lipoprotein
MKRIHPASTLWLVIILVVSGAGCLGAQATHTEYVLGTVCTVKLLQGGDEKLLDKIFARLREIESRMSANRDDTEIGAINRAAGTQVPVKVSDDTFFVISKALEYARLSSGAFDPTIGPLVKLWNIGNENARVPARKDIDAALALLDWRKVRMDSAAKTVRLEVPGMRLDLGAIAKGYAADECVRLLSAAKVKAAIVDLGGNVLVYGRKPDKTPWRVGVQNPDTKRGSYLGLVSGANGMTVVTSGIYERFFVEDGKHYHHILDTRAGYPVSNGLVSVTIIAASSIDADGLSTTLFALGRERGLELLRSFKSVYAIFVDESKRVWLSPGVNTMFRITDTAYTLAD